MRVKCASYPPEKLQMMRDISHKKLFPQICVSFKSSTSSTNTQKRNLCSVTTYLMTLNAASEQFECTQKENA